MTITGESIEEILRKLAASQELAADAAMQNDDQAGAELHSNIAETLSNAATRIEAHKADWQLYA